MISQIMNERIKQVARQFNAGKVSDFLNGRPTLKDDIFTDVNLTTDLETYMNGDAEIDYNIIPAGEQNYLIHIIKSKLYASL